MIPDYFLYIKQLADHARLRQNSASSAQWALKAVHRIQLRNLPVITWITYIKSIFYNDTNVPFGSKMTAWLLWFIIPVSNPLKWEVNNKSCRKSKGDTKRCFSHLSCCCDKTSDWSDLREEEKWSLWLTVWERHLSKHDHQSWSHCTQETDEHCLPHSSLNLQTPVTQTTESTDPKDTSHGVNGPQWHNPWNLQTPVTQTMESTDPSDTDPKDTSHRVNRSQGHKPWSQQNQRVLPTQKLPHRQDQRFVF